MKIHSVPEFKSIAGWKELLIEPVNEPLTLLNDLKPEDIVVNAGYHLQGIPGASNQQYLREDATQRLLKASELLHNYNPELKLSVLDAYRPLEVQAAIFKTFEDRLKIEHPEWDEETLSNETQRYVSIPSYDPTRPSPHNTGGAIDLVIIKDGKMINFGTEWDDFTEKAATGFFETAKSETELEARNNRRLLYTIMTEAGFTNYPEEWWHFDYGNQFWGKISGQTLFMDPQSYLND